MVTKVKSKRKVRTAHPKKKGRTKDDPLLTGVKSGQESGVFFMILSTLFSTFSLPTPLFRIFCLLFAVGHFLWKVGHTTCSRWAHLHRLHGELEANKKLIVKNRASAKARLRSCYRKKGLEGELLEQVVTAISSRENHLLQSLLEEETGARLTSHHHPLYHALGAGTGTLGAALSWGAGSLLGSWTGSFVVSGLLLVGGALWVAVLEKEDLTSALVWNLSIVLVISLSLYFLSNIVSK